MACFEPDTYVCLDVAQTFGGLNPNYAYRVVSEGTASDTVVLHNWEFGVNTGDVPCGILTDDPTMLSGKSSDK